MSYGKLAALAVAVAAVAAVAAAGAFGGDDGLAVVRFARGERGWAALSPAGDRLWTFPAGTGLEEAVRGRLAAELCPGGGPARVSPGAALEDGAVFRCRDGGAGFRLSEDRRRPHRARLNLTELSDPALVEASRQYWERLRSTPRYYPFSPVDILADGVPEALVWAYTFVTNHWGPLHEFPTWEAAGQTGVFHLGTGRQVRRTGEAPEGARPADGETVRLALTADWGSGTMEADYVSQLMEAWAPHYTVHMGDVYLLGTSDEVSSNCLGQAPAGAQVGVSWPKGSLGTFALEGNHEMYSRGYGYFDLFLPAIGQTASYFMLENEYWRVIGLDTGYNSYSPLIDAVDMPQPQPVVDWLRDVVNLGNASDTRGVVFLSHHQYLSAFDRPYNATAQQLAELLPAGRTAVWLWGHEHRLAVYGLTAGDDLPLSVYGRCVGVGGFPTELSGVPPDAGSTRLEAYDDRVYQVVQGLLNITTGYNGFTQLSFTGANLTVEYHSLVVDGSGVTSNTTSDLLMTEVFVADPGTGSVDRASFVVNNPNITVVD